jgi:hypothetical protein
MLRRLSVGSRRVYLWPTTPRSYLPLVNVIEFKALNWMGLRDRCDSLGMEYDRAAQASFKIPEASSQIRQIIVGEALEHVEDFFFGHRICSHPSVGPMGRILSRVTLKGLYPNDVRSPGHAESFHERRPTTLKAFWLRPTPSLLRWLGLHRHVPIALVKFQHHLQFVDGSRAFKAGRAASSFPASRFRVLRFGPRQ